MASVKERLGAAEAKAKAAEALLTPDMLEDLAALEKIERAEEREREAHEKLLTISLAARLEAAKAKAPGVAMKSLAIKGGAHSFIVANPGATAYQTWENGTYDGAMAAATEKKAKVDRVQSARDFAVAGVVDWNGIVDFDAGENGNDLIQFLTANPAIRAEIVGVLIDLCKVAAEERKSPHP